MDRAQGSLANLTSSSLALIVKLPAKKYSLKSKRIKKVERMHNRFRIELINMFLLIWKWEQLLIHFLLDNLKRIN